MKDPLAMVWKSNSIKHTQENICIIDGLMKSSNSCISTVADERNCYSKWMSYSKPPKLQRSLFSWLKKLDVFHQARMDILKTVEGDLSCVLFEFCEQDLQVNTQIICKEALHLLPASKSSCWWPRKAPIHHFRKNWNHSLCVNSCNTKRSHKSAEVSWHFMSMIHEHFMGMNPNDTLNMDQKLVLFSYHSNSNQAFEEHRFKPSISTAQLWTWSMPLE